jgi:hypothetical protein
MTQREENYPDPLIDEVRERRRRLLARHGGDLQKLYEELRRLQEEHPEKVVDRKKRRTLSGR